MSIDPAAAIRIAKLRLRARILVDGVLTGLHRSPHRGHSVEFSDHKEYSAGDDIRHIDWKTYGKSDRYYIKRFEQETNLQAVLVLDASASMAYCEPATKWEAACTLAAGFATLLAGQQDAVGLVIAHDSNLEFLPPRSSPGHINLLMEQLGSAIPSGPTDLGSVAQALGEKLRRRSLILVFSDLFDAHSEHFERLLKLRSQQHDVAIFQTLHPTELEFPFEETTLFLDMEGDRKLEVQPRTLRRGYLEELSRFLAGTEQLCRDRNCDYQRVRSDLPLEATLLPFLARRDRRGSGGPFLST